MTKLEIVILNHLSEARNEITSNPELADKRIQFVRTLIFDYPDTTTRISNETLDQIWNSLI
jgi:hypothetical protein